MIKISNSPGFPRTHIFSFTKPKILKNKYHNDSAVSPVVGIMLMLTVTLILAAIISGFTGGIANSQQKPPQLIFDASFVNSEGGEAGASFLDIRIISVSEGIPSKDLKFQTEWNDASVHRTLLTSGSDLCLYGYDPGNRTAKSFGNYTLLAGTHMQVNNSIDNSAMNAVLTEDWKKITEGTPIRIQFVHIPSGAIIADKEITAEV